MYGKYESGRKIAACIVIRSHPRRSCTVPVAACHSSPAAHRSLFVSYPRRHTAASKLTSEHTKTNTLPAPLGEAARVNEQMYEFYPWGEGGGRRFRSCLG